MSYRKVETRIWDDEKFCTLPGDHQALVFYLLSCKESNRIGLYRLSLGLAIEKLKVSPKVFRKRFRTVCETLHWEWDAQRCVLFLPTWWRYNPPAHVNNLIGSLKDLRDVPSTPLLSRFADNDVYIPEAMRQQFRLSFQSHTTKGYGTPTPTSTPGVGDVYPAQYQDRDQKQKQDREQEQDQNAPPPPDSFFLVEEVKDRWNEIPGVRHCELIEGALRVTVEEYRTKPREWWETLFDLVTNARCLTGRTAGLEGREPFQTDLDWTMNNLDIIFSGRYRDGASPGQCQNTVRRNGKSALCLEHVHVPVAGDPPSPTPLCLNCYHAWLEQEEENRRKRERESQRRDELLKQRQAERREQDNESNGRPALDPYYLDMLRRAKQKHTGNGEQDSESEKVEEAPS